MNKKELEALISNKLKEFDNLMKDGKYADAKKVQEEMNELQAIYDAMPEEATPKNTQPVDPVDSVKEFANAARHGFYVNAMSVDSDTDGGYTVPVDIRTRIETYRDSKKSLRSLVRVTRVTTESGQQTFKKRSQQGGFSVVGEGSAIGTMDTPQFERKSWSIEKYAGIFGVTNELLKDSDANITNVLVEWIGDESRVTDNKIILAAIAEKAKTKFSNLDDVKKALNVTLGSAFKNTSKIVTNDDGLQYFDTLKDNDGKYILRSNPADPMQMNIKAGALTIPIEVFPNCDMPSDPVYKESTTTTVNAKKAYFTRTGAGTTDDPYVYTKVANPTGNPSTSGYFEIEKYQVPIVVGDLNEYAELKDRESLTILSSNTAVAGGLNAFSNDLTLWRAIVREGKMVRDDQAIVNGYVEITA